MVVPDPNRAKSQVVRDYQSAMRANGKQEFTQGSLEAYVNMRVLAEGLERAGATRRVPSCAARWQAFATGIWAGLWWTTAVRPRMWARAMSIWGCWAVRGVSWADLGQTHSPENGRWHRRSA